MRWAAATGAALAACLGLCAWIALRDYDPGAGAANERPQATAQANLLLGAVTTRRECRGRCHAGLLARPAPYVWDVALQSPGRRRCVRIDLRRFAITGAHGVAGTRAVRCPRAEPT